MNAASEFIANAHSATNGMKGAEKIEVCPICEGFGYLDRDSACPYCDEGLITSTNKGWVILAAEVSGDIPLSLD